MSASSIRLVSCPHCRTPLALEAVSRSDLLRCAQCRTRFYISGAPVEGRTSRRAIASFVLAVSSLFIPCLAPIPAIVLGILALRDMRRAPGQLHGRELALAGIACGAFLAVLQALGAALIVWTVLSARIIHPAG